jgi:hypothetical protein
MAVLRRRYWNIGSPLLESRSFNSVAFIPVTRTSFLFLNIIISIFDFGHPLRLVRCCKRIWPEARNHNLINSSTEPYTIHVFWLLFSLQIRLISVFLNFITCCFQTCMICTYDHHFSGQNRRYSRLRPPVLTSHKSAALYQVKLHPDLWYSKFPFIACRTFVILFSLQSCRLLGQDIFCFNKSTKS